MKQRLSKAVGRVARGVRRLLNPDYESNLQRLETIERLIGKTSRLEREELAQQRQQIESLIARSRVYATSQDLHEINQHLESLTDSTHRQFRLVTHALKRADWLGEHAVDERRLSKRVVRLARSARPILVGPWTGEVGFELLYWIPFVNWVIRKGALDPRRLIVVSRGGAASWYAHIGSQYIDIFSHVTPDEFRVETEHSKKQKRVGEFDRRLIRRVMQSTGLPRVDLLHPGLMYRLFRPFWKQQATVRRIEAYTSYQPLGSVVSREFDVPAEYVAVRFYFSQCLPDTPENRLFVSSVVKNLSQRVPVVLLNTPYRVDDHEDVLAEQSDRIIRLDHLMSPERNLEVQTAVIAGARAFVGTYGGYSYLAPFCGVPSLAFYSDKTFFEHHLELAQRVFSRMTLPSLVPIDVRDADLVKMALESGTTAQSLVKTG